MILAEYEPIETRSRYGVNDIRLGLTGWAQINGRDAVTVEEKARLDGDKKLRGFLFRRPPFAKRKPFFVVCPHYSSRRPESSVFFSKSATIASGENQASTSFSINSNPEEIWSLPS